MLELLSLRQELTPDPEGAFNFFPFESHGLRLRGADFHHSCFPLGSKLPQCKLKAMAKRSQQNLIICYKQRWHPNMMLTYLRLRLDILSMNTTNTNGGQGTALVESNPLGTSSTSYWGCGQDLLWLYRDQVAFKCDPGTPTGCLQEHSGKISLNLHQDKIKTTMHKCVGRYKTFL